MEFKTASSIPYRVLSLLLIFCLFLQGCASSEVTRESAYSVDGVYARFTRFFGGAAHTNFAAAYQNASPTVKGAAVGGVAGAVVGGVTTGVGVAPGAAVGAIGGGAYGAYLGRRMSLKDQLKNHGVKIVVLGDQVLLVIPSELMFDGMTAAITPQGYATLDIVARVIRTYTKMTVRVEAFTSDAYPATVSAILTKQQAEKIVKALWRRKINTRLIYAVGGGCRHQVEPNCSDELGGANYRIEITLEKLPI